MDTQLDRIQIRYEPEPRMGTNWHVWVPVPPALALGADDIGSPYESSFWPTWDAAVDFVRLVTGPMCSYMHNDTESPYHCVPADYLMVNTKGEWFPVCAGDAPTWWSADEWKHDDGTLVTTDQYVDLRTNFNDTKRMIARANDIAARKRLGIDCTADESAVILWDFTRFAENDPGFFQSHSVLLTLFPLELDQWYTDRESGHMPWPANWKGTR